MQGLEEKFQEINATQEQLKDIKATLHKLISAMAEDPSYISRAAIYWGDFATWKKVTLGFLLVVPPLAIGITLQSFVLTAFSLFTMMTYTLVSLLLDNHYDKNKSAVEKLTEGINSLANVLFSMIQLLHDLHEHLFTEVDRLRVENESLAGTISLLGKEVQHLHQMSNQFGAVVGELSARFRDGAEGVQSAINQQVELIEKTDPALIFDMLTTLNQTFIDLNQKNEKISVQCIALKSLSTDLTDLIQFTASERAHFQLTTDTVLQRLDQEVEKQIFIFNEKRHKAINSLSTVLKEHTESNEDYRGLLDLFKKELYNLGYTQNHLEQQNPSLAENPFRLYSSSARAPEQLEEEQKEQNTAQSTSFSADL